MSEYPSKCPQCGADLPQPYGMNLFEMPRSRGEGCMKCYAKEQVKENERKIQDLEHENYELQKYL